MRTDRKTTIAAIFSLLLVPGTLLAQTIEDEGPDHHLLYRAGEIEWQDAPASLEDGAEVAVLEGNPGEAGVFTMRIKMPDGFYIAPHTHPNVERVTVISGTFLLGSGEEMNRNYTERLEPGSYTSMPPGMVHYAIAEGETVIQLTSVGPWIINYIDPEENDPRLTARQNTEPFLEDKLENPGEAEIHLAVAPHGEVDPDKLPDQIKTPSGSGPFWWLAVFD